MATYITEECINCGACEPECPNEAISEGEDIYVIDPKLCTECVGFHDHEACQAVCPVECCLPDPKNVETEENLISRARTLHPAWQFDARRGDTRPGLQAVLAALSEVAPDPHAADALMRARREDLDGRTLADLLAAGQDETVVRLLRAAQDQS